VLLPARRRWAWHDRLISSLSATHEVAVATLPSPAYPAALSLWLALSARPFRGAAAPVRGGAAPAPPSASTADLILDLSEGGPVPAGAPVLRPLYDGAADTMALAARLQRGQCPYLAIVDGAGAPVAASYAAIEDKAVLGRGLAQAYARVEALLLRAVAGQGSPLPPVPKRPPARFSSIALARVAARVIAGKLIDPLRRRAIRHGHWNIALRRRDGVPDLVRFDLADWQKLPADSAIFYADPFIFEEGGRTWLFAEAYPYAAGKGAIACAELSAAGAPGPFHIVLEEPWHLSYPYLFRAEGETWLVPESGEQGGVYLYRAERLPDRWRRERRLLQDLRLVDATLFEHDGRLWMLAGAIGPDGGSSWDELFAWHAPALAGPWTAHALNPIKSDCRGARPGGRPLRLDGRLLRPAQRCEQGYGESLVWMEVRTLTPDAFEEVEVAEWRGGPGNSGLHSADLAGPVQAVDFRYDLKI
jgi:hypothetical protein